MAQPFPDLEAARAWAEQAFADWAQEVTPAEQRAIGVYQSEQYAIINGVFLGREPFRSDPRAQELVVATAPYLDQIIARGQIDRDIVVYRGYCDSGVYLSAQPGFRLSHPNYVSTSLDRQVALDIMEGARYRVLIELHLPRGLNAAYLPLVGKGTEAELLLPRGIIMVVRKSRLGDKLRLLTAEVAT